MHPQDPPPPPPPVLQPLTNPQLKMVYSVLINDLIKLEIISIFSQFLLTMCACVRVCVCVMDLNGKIKSRATGGEF